MATNKIETNFTYKNEIYYFICEKNGLKCYIKEDNDVCMITDENNNILFKIIASCSQGMGYIEAKNT